MQCTTDHLWSCFQRTVMCEKLGYYIAVLAKMQFFKISVILCFSVGLLFYFSGQLFSTDLHQIWHECVTLHRIEADEGDFWKVQIPGHNSQKTLKIGQFFASAVIFSLVVTKRLNFFQKSLLRWHLGCYTFQNCLVFSIIKPNGGSKKTNFEGNYPANHNNYGQSLYEV